MHGGCDDPDCAIPDGPGDAFTTARAHAYKIMDTDPPPPAVLTEMLALLRARMAASARVGDDALLAFDQGLFAEYAAGATTKGDR